MSSNEERAFNRLLDEQRAQNNPASVNAASEAEWRTKLAGKKIVDGQAYSVRYPHLPPASPSKIHSCLGTNGLFCRRILSARGIYLRSIGYFLQER